MTHNRRISELEKSCNGAAKLYTVEHPVGRYLATKEGADPDAVTYQQIIQYELYGRWATEGGGYYSDLELSDELRQAGIAFNAAKDAERDKLIASLPEGVTYTDYIIQQVRASQ